jgi:hypothetical protein
MHQKKEKNVKDYGSNKEIQGDINHIVFMPQTKVFAKNYIK